MSSPIPTDFDSLTPEEREFQLQIYHWLAAGPDGGFGGLTAPDASISVTYHATREAAIAFLEAYPEAYAFAVLARNDGLARYGPCDWEGHSIAPRKPWPRRRGTNGQHPAMLALVADWPELKRMVWAEHVRTGEPTVPIAIRVLRERHPHVGGYAEPLGQAALEEATHVHQG